MPRTINATADSAGKYLLDAASPVIGKTRPDTSLGSWRNYCSMTAEIHLPSLELLPEQPRPALLALELRIP